MNINKSGKRGGRILSILLSALLLVGLTPSLSFGIDASPGNYTVTLKTDDTSGKLDAIQFLMTGAVNDAGTAISTARVRTMDSPIKIKSTSASISVQMNKRPEDLLAYTVSVDGVSQKVVLYDIIDSPPGTTSTATLHTLSDLEQVGKITTRAGQMSTSVGDFVLIYFDNSKNTFDGKNIDEYIFTREASIYTATAADAENGTASAIDLGFNWSQLTATRTAVNTDSAKYYKFDYWEYSVNGETGWVKDDNSVGKQSYKVTLDESRYYRPVFTLEESGNVVISKNPTHAAIIADLADGEEGSLVVGEHTYTVKREGNDIILTAYSGPGGSLEIPQGITEIGARDVNTTGSVNITSVFSNSTTVTGAVIPEGVSTINNRAFHGCTNLTEVSLPDTLTAVGYAAFFNNGLAEIEFPGNLKDVGISAFNGTKIVEANIPLAMSAGIWGSGVFANCIKLEEVIFPQNTTMTTLPESFVNGCTKLTNFTIPESVVEIGISAFDKSAIEHIVIPKNVKTIGQYAFRECSQLRSVEFLGSSLDSIGTGVFSACTNLKEFTYPYEVKTFNTGIFNNSTNIETITMPDVTTHTAFGANFFPSTITNLKTIIFPQVPETTTLADNWANAAHANVTIYTRRDSNVETKLKGLNSWKNANIKYLDFPRQVTVQNGNDITFAGAGLAVDWRLAAKYDYGLTVPRAKGLTAIDVTALDALFAAHEAVYGKEVFNPDTYKTYLQTDENGTVTQAFGLNTYQCFVNGVKTEDLAATAVTEKDTVHFSYGNDTSAHYSFTLASGAPTYDITMMPETDYTLTVAADGSGSPVADAAVYAAFHPAGKDVSGFKQVGTTGADGKVTLRFTSDEIGGHIVYAKKDGYAFSPLRVTVQGADARLGSIVATPDKPFETLTKLASGYDAGTLVKAGASGENISEGFDPDHHTYNYYVNSNTERLSFGVTENYEDSAQFMTIAASAGNSPIAGFTAAASDAWSAIPVTLAEGYDSKTPVTFDITYEEEGQTYTQSYTVNVIKSENAAYSWLLDLEPTGSTEAYGQYWYTTRPSNRTLYVYKGDEFATATLKVSAGVTLSLDGQKQTPDRTDQHSELQAIPGTQSGRWLVDEYDISIPVPDLTGKNPNSLNVAYCSVTVDMGTSQETHEFNVYVRSHYDEIFTPDRVSEYKPVAGQFIYSPFAKNAHNVLRADTHYIGSMVSLGGHGGSLTVEYDDPITNNPNNPYGVDFIIYGNAFEGGKASEPASVEVSENGTEWYYLAGSHHYELNVAFDREATVNYTNEIVKSMVFLGETGYPNVTFGYADVSSCSEIANAGYLWGVKGDVYNPYTADLKNNIGDGFDLSWAVDKDGKPVQIDSVKYVRMQNVIDVKENGAFGEVSPEISTIIKTRPSDQLTPIEVTDEPETITIGGQTLSELNLTPIAGNSFNDGQITYYELDLTALGGASAGYVPVHVTGSDELDNIYVNAQRGVGELSYNALLDDTGSRTVRIITQSGDKQARISVIKMTGGNAEAAAKNTDIASVSLIPGDVTLTKGEDGNYSATVANSVQNVKLAASALNPEATVTLGETPLEAGEMSDPLPVTVGANTFTVDVTSADGMVTTPYTVVITREAAASDTITVWFEFTGDDIHYTFDGGEKKDEESYSKTGEHNAKTWISRRQVTVPTGSTVKYVTDMLLMNANIEFSSRDGGTYIDWVKIPAASGNTPVGERLAEFSNGPNSGWMYRYNGYIADEGYAARVLENGTQIRWFYTDDYTLEDDYEPGNWGFPTTPGDDETPDDPPETPVIVVTPDAPVVNSESGVAEAAVTEGAFDKAIADAEEAVKEDSDTAARIEIRVPKTEQEAAGVTVSLPTAQLEKVADSEAVGELVVITEAGDFELDSAALAKIVQSAGGEPTVTLTITKEDVSAVPPADQPQMTGASIFDVEVRAGQTVIHELGSRIKISLPYELKSGEKAENVRVYYLPDQGAPQVVEGATYDRAAAKASFYTDHLSLWAVKADGESEPPAAKDGWAKQADGTWKYYADGTAFTGWLYDTSYQAWYYLDKTTGIMKTGWARDNGVWYYLASNGKMVTSKWLKDAGTWYYLTGNGAMKTGWQKNGGSWYYLAGNGKMVANKWLKEAGKWYYLSGSGKMLTGNRIVGGKAYTFKTNGVWVR
jgi:glucan-binding YG repeat protein